MNEIKIKERMLSYEVNEEIKALRTNIQFCREDNQAIVFTSCVGGEGKSTLTLDLSMSMAAIKKVVLIDADLRKSVMVRNLENTSGIKGLAHLLSGQGELEEVLCKTNVKNLDMILAGPVIPPNPSELLSSDNFEQLLVELRKKYDYIIIDSPPVGMVIDPCIIAEKSDGSVIVVESGIVKYRHVQEIKKKLEKSSCPILGVVINKMQRKKSERYYHKYYKEYYGHNQSES